MKMEVWTTKDGRRMRVAEMSNEHLLNAHRFVREKLVEIENFQRNAFIFAPGKDTMAYDDFEATYLDSFERQARLTLWAMILGKEIARRGLRVLEPRIKLVQIEIEDIRCTEYGRIIKLKRR